MTTPRKYAVPPGWPIGVSSNFQAAKPSTVPAAPRELKYSPITVSKADLERYEKFRDEVAKAVDVEIARRAKEVDDEIARRMRDMLAHPITYVQAPPRAVTWQREWLGSWADPSPSPAVKREAVKSAPPPSLAVDPLGAEIDGMTLRTLMHLDVLASRETPRQHGIRASFSNAQKAAISARWSAELRRKVEASRAADAERERLRVVVDLEDE